MSSTVVIVMLVFMRMACTAGCGSGRKFFLAFAGFHCDPGRANQKQLEDDEAEPDATTGTSGTPASAAHGGGFKRRIVSARHHPGGLVALPREDIQMPQRSSSVVSILALIPVAFLALELASSKPASALDQQKSPRQTAEDKCLDERADFVKKYCDKIPKDAQDTLEQCSVQADQKYKSCMQKASKLERINSSTGVRRSGAPVPPPVER